jgi:hypothetical protein
LARSNGSDMGGLAFNGRGWEIARGDGVECSCSDATRFV